MRNAEYKKLHLWLIRFVGLIVPQRLRADWRQEWEAELRHREAMLAQWDKLNTQTKLDLLRRSTSAFIDALWLLPKRWEDELMQDIRFGLRLMLKQPGVTAVMIIVLGLGVGANTAIFSVVNPLVFNPLPYPNPQQLMWVTSDFRGEEIIGGGMFLAYEQESQTFERLALYHPPYPITVASQGEPEKISQAAVTASMFATLDVKPMLGRAFVPEDEQPGAPHVVVLAYDYWQRRLGGNPAVVGQELLLGKEKWTVIGVMPRGFRFLPERRAGGNVDILVPLIRSEEMKNVAEFEAIGRLKAGVMPTQAQAELEVILQRLIRQPAPPGQQMPPDFHAKVTPLAERLVGHLRRGLLVLFGMVLCVLLIACANVANLLLARAGVRQKEMAVRAALGAGRKRLMRQMLTESLMLSLVGGLAGFWLAWWGVKALVALTPEDMPQLKLARVDNTVLWFTFIATLLTGVVAGLIPAWQAARVDVNESLKDGARGSSFLQRKSARRVSPALVVFELALTLVLLIGAGLLIKSFIRLRAVDAGYNASNLLTMGLSFKDWRTSAERQTLQERLSALPGMRAVAYSGDLPMHDRGIIHKRRFTIAGRPLLPEAERPLAEARDVGPGAFRVMETPLIAGRDFTERDDVHAPPVIIINATFARRHFAGEDPLGQRITFDDAATPATIIGVTADVKWTGLAAESQAGFCTSLLQMPEVNGVDMAIRTAGDPLPMLPMIRQVVAEVMPNERLYNPLPMEQRLAESLAPRRLQLLLFSIFAGVALILAAVGVYGVISYSVSRRTHEIGIRMALGAQAHDVLLLVVRQGVIWALIGVAFGLAAAYALTRLMESLLFNVRPADPATFAAVSLLLVSIAVLAAYLPARRATKVDPMVALRHD